MTRKPQVRMPELEAQETAEVEAMFDLEQIEAQKRRLSEMERHPDALEKAVLWGDGSHWSVGFVVEGGFHDVHAPCQICTLLVEANQIAFCVLDSVGEPLYFHVSCLTALVDNAPPHPMKRKKREIIRRYTRNGAKQDAEVDS